MLPLQFITHQTERYSYEESAEIALKGGCKWIQLRMKGHTDDEVRPIARRLLKACRAAEAVLIIDDRVHLVNEIQCDGVHLGQQDMPITEARSLLGEGFLIGGTANTPEQAVQVCVDGGDYVGCGPFRFTTTKENLSPVLGLEGYKSIVSALLAKRIRRPICAIGGITLDDVPAIMQTGVQGIAVSGAILHAPDPIQAIHRFLHCPY